MALLCSLWSSMLSDAFTFSKLEGTTKDFPRSWIHGSAEQINIPRSPVASFISLSGSKRFWGCQCLHNGKTFFPLFPEFEKTHPGWPRLRDNTKPPLGATSTGLQEAAVFGPFPSPSESVYKAKGDKLTVLGSEDSKVGVLRGCQQWSLSFPPKGTLGSVCLKDLSHLNGEFTKCIHHNVR